MILILNIVFRFTNLLRNETSSLICILFIMCLVRYLQRRYELRKIYKFASKFPGPETIPGFGNELSFLTKDRDIFRALLKYSSIYGSHYRLWLNNHLFIVISSTKDIADVLLNPKLVSKGKLFENAFGKCLGKGLFSTDAVDWKMKRKILVLPSRKSVLTNYTTDMNELTDQYIALLESNNKIGKEINFWELLPWLPFNIFCKTMLDLQTIKDFATDYSTSFIKSASTVLGLCFQQLFIPIICGKLYWQLMRKIIKQAAFDMAVNYFRVKSQEENVNEKILENSDETSPKFIHYLKNNYFSEQDRKDEITTWTSGGTETLSVSMNFVLLMLAMHQDIQDKVYKELIDVLGKSSTVEIGTKDTEKLIYLEQVIYETLRYFPLTPFVIRYVSEDTTIGKHMHPAGTYLILNFYGVHYDSGNYERPEAFYPDHFSSENRKRLSKGAFLSFSIGPRDCIGKAFALLQMKIVLSKLILRFHITTKMKKEDINLVCGFVLTNGTGFKICLSERN